MRKKIVAGNWKMNLNLQDGVALATNVKDSLANDKPHCDVVVCTPFIHLASVAEVLKGSVVGLGAENCADKEKGAYTGEVSAEMVKSTGAQYVILGHSERRQYYGETAEILKEKVLLALKHGLKVIFCCGETLEQREMGIAVDFIRLQIKSDLKDVPADKVAEMVIAYEPIWAIGTGKTATSEQAEEICKAVRDCIEEMYDKATADKVRIQYGGSVNAANAAELFGKPDIDGALVGGASLKPDFGKIVNYK